MNTIISFELWTLWYVL